MNQMIKNTRTKMRSILSNFKKSIIIGPTKSVAISEQVATARKNGDASMLDLALRAEFHFANRGKSVDTSSMEFSEVKALNPQFYG